MGKLYLLLLLCVLCLTSQLVALGSFCFRRELLVIIRMFLRAGCAACHPAISIKALQGTQSTNPSQWPSLILSVAISILLTESVGSQMPVPIMKYRLFSYNAMLCDEVFFSGISRQGDIVKNFGFDIVKNFGFDGAEA